MQVLSGVSPFKICFPSVFSNVNKSAEVIVYQPEDTTISDDMVQNKVDIKIHQNSTVFKMTENMPDRFYKFGLHGTNIVKFGDNM